MERELRQGIRAPMSPAKGCPLTPKYSKSTSGPVDQKCLLSDNFDEFWSS